MRIFNAQENIIIVGSIFAHVIRLNIDQIAKVIDIKKKIFDARYLELPFSIYNPKKSEIIVAGK